MKEVQSSRATGADPVDSQGRYSPFSRFVSNYL